MSELPSKSRTKAKAPRVEAQTKVRTPKTPAELVIERFSAQRGSRESVELKRIRKGLQHLGIPSGEVARIMGEVEDWLGIDSNGQPT